MHENEKLKEYAKHIKRILISEEEIQTAIKNAGKAIDEIYDGRPISS